MATKSELLRRAKELHIRSCRKMTSDELTAAIAAAEAEEDRVAAVRAEQRAKEAERQHRLDMRKAKAAERAELDLSSFSAPESESEWAWTRVRCALRNLEWAKRAQGEFVENMSKDAMYALRWGDSMFEASAAGEVADAFLFSWKAGMNDEDLAQFITDRLANSATNGNSTSACSNLADRFETKAWSNLLTAW